MGHIYEYNGIRPIIKSSAFIHPQAVVIGQVEIGENVYVGPGAVLRGDWGKIIIHDGANVQENCVFHSFPGIDVLLEEEAHIGHGAIIHSGTVRKNAMIGMGAIVMDRAIVEENAIVGALCLVPTGFVVPRQKMVVGIPAKIIGDVSDEMVQWKREGTRLYQTLAKEAPSMLKICEPLREKIIQIPLKEIAYKIWKDSK